MATLRRPRRHVFTMTTATELTEEQRRLIESVFGASIETPTKTTKKAPRKPLRNRTLRAKAVYPCRRKPDALHAAAILWPAGVPHEGCGRTFASEKRRDIHEAGTDWNPVQFPNGCLDRILPAELRDTR